MKFLAPLLMTAAVAGAIPLRKGESWTWLLVNRSTNAHSWVSADVLGSVKHDSGVVWQISALDSATSNSDTGSILVRPDGSQNWMRGSRYLPWEPGLSRSTSLPEATVARSGPFPWGVVSEGVSSGVPWYSSWGVTISAGEMICGGGAGEHGSAYRDCPEHVWGDAVGVLRARINNVEWILERHNGQAIAPTLDSLTIPVVGSRMIWRETVDSVPLHTLAARVDTSRSVLERTWTILERARDSAGWSGGRIREEIRTDSVLRSNEFDLRLNSVTGARMPPRGSGAWLPDEAWWRHWSDSTAIGSQTRFRLQSGESSSTAFGVGGHTAYRRWMKVDSSGQMDSLSCGTEDDPYNVSAWFSGITLRRVLLFTDGTVVRASSLAGTHPSTTLRRASGFRELAARFPAVQVRWRDAQGRSGVLPAKRLLQGGQARVLLFLDARLPDGSAWSGVCLPGAL